MVADSANHTPATFQENTGFRLNGFPVLGSWASYGLGCETDELPAYVVLPDPRGLPAGSTINWSNGFLPARHQGVAFKTKGEPIDDLFPARPIDAATERASRDLLATLNQRHLEKTSDDVLAARIRGYELAAKMQLAVPKVLDLGREPTSMRTSYGMDDPETADFGHSCLLARRLLEQGVRFVQLFSGGSFGSPRINWDGHENMKENHGQEAKRIDRPVAALFATSASVACSTIPWFSSQPNLAAHPLANPPRDSRRRPRSQYVWLFHLARRRWPQARLCLWSDR